jgi:hypothetical protein
MVPWPLVIVTTPFDGDVAAEPVTLSVTEVVAAVVSTALLTVNNLTRTTTGVPAVLAVVGDMTNLIPPAAFTTTTRALDPRNCHHR